MNRSHRDRTPAARNPELIEREIEPKAALRSDRREFLGDDDRTELSLQDAAAEFDIEAWFALDQAEDDESRERCIAECWYG
jgi:hypothetical protein